MNILLCLSISILFIYAFTFQKNEWHDTFKHTKTEKNTTPRKALYHIKTCLLSPQRAVKWRTVLMATVSTMVILFIFVHSRFPTNSEIIMYFMIIYIVFYCMVKFMDSTVHKGAYMNGLENLKILRKIL